MADKLKRIDLGLATAAAPNVDDFARPEIDKGGIGRIAHRKPGS
jgi:hypothetical protein